MSSVQPATQPKRPKWWDFPLILVGMFGGLLIGSYGRWELLTATHGAELRAALEKELDKGLLLSPPCFFKVISYSPQKADVFMVENPEGAQDVILHFERARQGNWTMPHGYELCTVANGSPTCFFPWYMPMREIKGQLSVYDLPFGFNEVPEAACQQNKSYGNH